MKTKILPGLPLLFFLSISCSERDLTVERLMEMRPSGEDPPVVVVDCAEKQGDVMRLERANGHSTTSPLPGEKTQEWLQGLEHKLVRTWIQLRYVYNKGDIDYNYEYQNSHVPVESSLDFYSKTADSLLIALSAYNPTSAWPLPEGEDFKDFIRETLIYYKTKYPKIKYIQVGNEPDHGGETMETYYPIYQHYYRAVNEANQALGIQDNPLLISNGAFTSNVPNMLAYADGFLAAYAADEDPDKKLDFFSFHSYGETNRPLELLEARNSINQAMQSHGLPVIPVFVSEYGIVGGSSLPKYMTLQETMLVQPAGQLTKAFYLYEGGVDNVFHWNIHHGSIEFKQEIGNLENAYPYPYGNALLFCKEISERGTRIGATSARINEKGLGTHVLASMDRKNGIAVMVWNYNWRDDISDERFDVLIKNIPQKIFHEGKIRSRVFLIDSAHNNYFNNPDQTMLTPSVKKQYQYKSSLSIPLELERHAVALILLEPN